MEPERVQIVGAVDMPGGTIRGQLDVLQRHHDGRGREVVDVGRNRSATDTRRRKRWHGLRAGDVHERPNRLGTTAGHVKQLGRRTGQPQRGRLDADSGCVSETGWTVGPASDMIVTCGNQTHDNDASGLWPIRPVTWSWFLHVAGFFVGME